MTDAESMTGADAAEVAAECAAAIDWQTDNLILNMDADTIASTEMIEAMRPKRPATLRLIKILNEGSQFRAMKQLVSPMGQSVGIVPMATTVNSIGRALANWGFANASDQILAALERHNLAAIKHSTKH